MTPAVKSLFQVSPEFFFVGPGHTWSNFQKS